MSWNPEEHVCASFESGSQTSRGELPESAAHRVISLCCGIWSLSGMADDRKPSARQIYQFTAKQLPGGASAPPGSSPDAFGQLAGLSRDVFNPRVCDDHVCGRIPVVNHLSARIESVGVIVHVNLRKTNIPIRSELDATAFQAGHFIF